MKNILPELQSAVYKHALCKDLHIMSELYTVYVYPKDQKKRTT